MNPTRYQSKPEGGWERWIKGHIDPDILRSKVDIDSAGCYINGCYVFALIGEDKRIWNCQTGWQTKGML